MKQIFISEEVHRELESRVGDLTPAGAYLKGFLDGMIQTHDPRDFRLELRVVAVEARESQPDTQLEPESAGSNGETPVGAEARSVQEFLAETEYLTVDARTVVCKFCEVAAGENCQSRYGRVYPDRNYHMVRIRDAWALVREAREKRAKKARAKKSTR